MFLEFSTIIIGIILSIVFCFFYKRTEMMNHFIGVGLLFTSLFIINISQIIVEIINKEKTEQCYYDESGFKEGKDFFNRDKVITIKILENTGDTLVIDTALVSEKEIYGVISFVPPTKERDKRVVNVLGGNTTFAVIPRSPYNNDTLFVNGLKVDTIQNKATKFYRIHRYHGQIMFSSKTYSDVIWWKDAGDYKL